MGCKYSARAAGGRIRCPSARASALLAAVSRIASRGKGCCFCARTIGRVKAHAFQGFELGRSRGRNCGCRSQDRRKIQKAVAAI